MSETDDPGEPSTHTVEICETLSGLLIRMHPDDGLDAYMRGIELLLNLDDDMGIATLGWLHDYGPNVVESIAELLDIPVAEIVDVSPCVGCGQNVAYLEEFAYMVRDAVWDEGGAGSGCLCVGCLEARIGRQLEPGDFPDLPFVTDPRYVRSPRLVARITGQPQPPG